MTVFGIHSVPRSGSTWLGNIFNSHPHVNFKYQPLFSYSFKSYLDENSGIELIEDFFVKLGQSRDSFLNQEESIKEGLVPDFPKKSLTHLCYKEVRYHYILQNLLRTKEDFKVILLVRNPLAVLFSWYNAPKEFRKDKNWNFREEWRFGEKKNQMRKEEYYGYEKWKEATELFLKLQSSFPTRVRLVAYNKLLKEKEEVISQLFDFVGLKMTPQTANFIFHSTASHSPDPYSIYKTHKLDNKWKQLPEDIIAYVKDDLMNTGLESFVYG